MDTNDLPWDKPVDGAELLNEIAAFLRRYLSLPPGAAEILALWAVFTHMMPAFDIATRIYVWSLTGDCGKSVLQATMAQLWLGPMMDSGGSPPAIYRAIDAAGRAKDATKGCTIFLDESDNRSISGLMLAVLNSGHYRHLAYIPRVVRGEPYNFSTFAPILIATRGRTLKSNLRSRTLEFQMHPALPEDCSDRTTPPL